MKVQLDKSEVYKAIHVYMLLKGFVASEYINQQWTNKDGLLSLGLDIQKHNQTEEETIKILKKYGIFQL